MKKKQYSYADQISSNKIDYFQGFPYKSIRPEQGRLILDAKKFMESALKYMIFKGDVGMGKEAAMLWTIIKKGLREYDKIVYVCPTANGKKEFIKEFLQPSMRKYLSDCLVLENKCSLCDYKKKMKIEKGLSDSEISEAVNTFCSLFKNECPFKQKNKCSYYSQIDEIDMKKIIVCDFNYIFSPYINTLKKKLEDSKVLLIVNEVHEAPDKIVNNSTWELSTKTIDLAIRELSQFKFKSKSYDKELKQFKKQITTVKCPIDEKAAIKAKSLAKYSDLAKHLLSCGKKIILKKFTDRKGIISHSYVLGNFLSNWMRKISYSDIHLFYLDKSRSDKGNINTRLGITILSPFARSYLKMFDKCILFSGSCYPERYRDFFGLPSEQTYIPENYVFDVGKRNRTNIFYLDGELTQSYRATKAFKKSARELQQLINICPKPMMIFCTTSLWEKFQLDLNLSKFKWKLWRDVPKPDRKKAEQEMVHEYEVNITSPWGCFSQSINLSGLKTTIIAGMPDKKLDLVTQSRIAFLMKKNKNDKHKLHLGYNSIVRLPAIERSMQCIGRGIRSEKDKMLVIFFDKRWIHHSRYIANRDEFGTVDQLGKMNNFKFLKEKNNIHFAKLLEFIKKYKKNGTRK